MHAMGYLTIMGTINMPFFIFSIPRLFYQLLFINAVQIPDMEGDKLGGKYTWIVKKGRLFGFKTIFMAGTLASASLNLKIIAILSILPLSFAILSYLKRSENRNIAVKLVNKNFLSLILFLN